MGYFPTYTLGAIYAAQIFFAAKKAIPDLEKSIEAGKFSALREWLREKVHKVGSVPSSADELMKLVTGEPLNVSFFLDYLRSKYLPLYKVA
jgi:carboxypeptidase Taq